MGKAKSAIETQREMLIRARKFVERVKKKLKIEEVYVVGSRARGDFTDESDIDLVIISEDVKGIPYLKRVDMLSEFLEPKVEFFIYTREEWENPSSLYIKEMKKESKRLVDLLKEYEVYIE